MRLRGVTFDSTRGHKATFIEEVFDVAWNEADLLRFFSRFDAQSKETQQLWTAAKYREGFRRCLAGIVEMYCAVLDRDSADVGSLDETCSHLDRLGLAYIVYSTWSHGRPEKNYKGLVQGPFDCFRVVLPYSRPVSVIEHAAIVQGLIGHELPPDPPKYRQEVLGRFSTSEDGRERTIAPRGWDPVSTRAAQGYFLPSAIATIDVREGAPLDVEAVLARPTTPRPTNRRVRSYSSPCRIGLGATAAVEAALARRGVVLGPEGHGGWRRAPCPSCAPSGQQRSPSLTVRANGDGVDIHCHDRCYRHEILRALGLTPGDFRAPSDLRLALEEQLQRQEPTSDPIPIEETVKRLEIDLREALESKRPTVIQYPAGTGKSFASAKIIAERVQKGLRVAYVTQEHVVAAETRSLLSPRVVSLHHRSPLVKLGSAPQCFRVDELKERVFEFGDSLLGKICPKCALRNECDAYKDASARHRAADDAQALFVSHAGIGQLFSSGKGDDLELIVDEMPSVYEDVKALRPDVVRIARGEIAPSAAPLSYAISKAIAVAWLVGAAPGEVFVSGAPQGRVYDLLHDSPRLRLREGVTPQSDEKPLLEAADALLRLAAYAAEGGHVPGFEALIPSAAHVELVRRRGVLLSATPMLAALPDFDVRRVDVTDGAPVRRVMVLSGNRGSGALTSMYRNAVTGAYERRERREGEGVGVDWPALDAALGRALAEAEKYPDRRVLFVTFKSVADALRSDPSRLGSNISVGHFGALRGKNMYMEGRELESSVVYLFGTPRMNMLPTIAQLGLVGDAADAAWIDYAAAELSQAEGRLRLPRRTKPCTVFCEGDVCPSGWTTRNIDELIELGLTE